MNKILEIVPAVCHNMSLSTMWLSDGILSKIVNNSRTIKTLLYIISMDSHIHIVTFKSKKVRKQTPIIPKNSCYLTNIFRRSYQFNMDYYRW